MHIRVIVPIINKQWEEDARRCYGSVAHPGTEVSAVCLDWGPASIESYRDEYLAVPDILGKVVEAERLGADAAIIDCMADPGLPGARELVRIPVVGPAQATLHMASVLGHRFSVLTVFDDDAPSVEELVARYGLSSRLASVRGFNIAVLDLAEDPDRAVETVVAVAERAVRQDGAHVIVPGCTGLAGLAPRIQAGLAARGCEVPVLDPPSVAMKVAEMLVEMGQAHSRRSYSYPPAKRIDWPVENAACGSV